MAIEDYFKGSSQAYGQLAGSLLAGRRNEDKKQAKRALLASTVMATFGALQNKQKQSIIDGANDVKEQYSDIFNQNKQEFESYSEERNRLKMYQKEGNNYLNREAATRVNSTDAAIEMGVSFENRRNEPREVREKLMAAFNAQKNAIKAELEALEKDPRATSKTLSSFNQKAMDEYKAALSLVEDDPTKKGILREGFNKIFGTARDGTKRFGMAERAELENVLNAAKENRTNFRSKIEDIDNLLTEENPEIGLSEEGLVDAIKNKTKVYSSDEQSKQINITLNSFLNKKGEDTEYYNTPFNIDMKTSSGKIKTKDLKKELSKGNIYTIDNDGNKVQVDLPMFTEILSVQQLANNDALLRNSQDALVGARSIDAVLNRFAQEKRFKIDGNNIIFTAPSRDGRNLLNNTATTSDVISSLNEKPLDSENMFEGKRFSSVGIFNIFQDEEFLQGSEQEKIEAINYLKQQYPKQSEEIDMLYNNTLEQIIEYKEQQLKEYTQGGLRKFLPESMFKDTDLEKFKTL
tara:strand:- start:3242 stop:4801 length:1560 start_codon:yes stop_codon:yes gene_type:complete